MNVQETAPDTEKEKPGYYAVIPASVRYDKNVPAGAKLLYGEITALTKKEGFCWAGNEYFAQLYDKDGRTIRNWINSLHTNGHIIVSKSRVSVQSKFTMEVREIETRVIKLPEPVIHKPVIPASVQDEDPPATEDNPPAAAAGDEVDTPAAGNRFPSRRKKFSGGMETGFRPDGKNFPRDRKNFSKPPEKNFHANITKLYNTATAAPDPDSRQPDGTFPPGCTAAAFSPQEIKNAVLSVDPCLSLDDTFYAEAAAFCAQNSLDLQYPAWLYAQCELKNPRSLDGLYYTLFRAANMAEKYTATRRREAQTPDPPPPKTCPVCGAEHPPDSACPVCGLRHDPTQDEIELFRELHQFPPEKRAEYVLRRDSVSLECGKDFKQFKIRMDSLDAEFGITPS